MAINFHENYFSQMNHRRISRELIFAIIWILDISRQLIFANIWILDISQRLIFASFSFLSFMAKDNSPFWRKKTDKRDENDIELTQIQLAMVFASIAKPNKRKFK